MEKRWQIEVIQVEGDRALLVSTFAAVGFELIGDLLSGNEFEKLDDEKEVRTLAGELGRQFKRISEVQPELDLRFSWGQVHEHTQDGQHRKHTAIEISGAAALGFASFNATLTDSSLTEDERIEQQSQAKADQAAMLIKAARARPDVLIVLELLSGEPTSMELYKVYEIVKDNIGRTGILKLATKPAFKNFTGSLNNPKVLGRAARHWKWKYAPPKNPMNLVKCTEFARSFSDKWIRSI